MLTTYREVFKDIELGIIPKLVNTNWSMGTKYLAKYKPVLISDNNELQLYGEGVFEDVGFTGIKMGRFVIQVAVMKSTSISSKKVFIVYDVNKKVGMPVTARTVEEAYSRAVRMYDNFMEEFNKLKEISKDRRNNVELLDKYGYMGYKVYVALVGPPMQQSVYIVAPGVLRKVNKKLREKSRRRKKETLNNLVPA